MGADPIAMCGKCREVVSMFSLTACVDCINERYGVDIDNKAERVLNRDNGVNKNWVPNCHQDEPCYSLIQLDKCLKQNHNVLIDPCW